MTRAAGARARSRGTAPAAAADGGDVGLERVGGRAGCAPLERPDGSPIIPVPPPTTATGPPAVTLQAEQPEDRDEVPDMQRVGGRIEPDVAGDRLGPAPGAPASPGVVGVQDAAPLELVEQAGAGLRGGGRVTGTADRGVPDREAAYERSFTDPMLSCGLRCRPPSRGGSVIDAPWAAGPYGRGGSALRRILIAIPIIILLVSVLLAGAGALFTVAAYNYYAAGPARPQAQP